MDFREVNWWRWQPAKAWRSRDFGRYLMVDLDRERAETLAGLPKVDRESLKALIAEAKAETAAVIEALEKVRRELAGLRRGA